MRGSPRILSFFPALLSFYLFSKAQLIDSMLEHQFPTRINVYLDILSTNNNIRCTRIKENKVLNNPSLFCSIHSSFC